MMKNSCRKNGKNSTTIGPLTKKLLGTVNACEKMAGWLPKQLCGEKSSICENN